MMVNNGGRRVVPISAAVKSWKSFFSVKIDHGQTTCDSRKTDTRPAEPARKTTFSRPDVPGRRSTPGPSPRADQETRLQELM
jgi:hypothetical protein